MQVPDIFLGDLNIILAAGKVPAEDLVPGRWHDVVFRSQFFFRAIAHSLPNIWGIPKHTCKAPP